jgi:hypothetical protein
MPQENIAIRLTPRTAHRFVDDFVVVVERDADSSKIQRDLMLFARKHASCWLLRKLGIGFTVDEIYYAGRNIYLTQEPVTYPRGRHAR